MKQTLICLVALSALGASAQDCRTATRNYEVSNAARTRNQEMVDRAYYEMTAACGTSPGAGPAQAQRAAPQYGGTRIPPGSFVNCDQAGCWGASNSVRYNFVAGGNLAGADGSFCARGAGNTFSCN